ncbi:hypothetical protein NT6N_25680 [Oceaniferula spumae]|uniref:Uncharacterized protein n=1 Tax=Oceaniferula spumae TaxID=2979115 RepID=A0AAT9FNK1_9BACT
MGDKKFTPESSEVDPRVDGGMYLRRLFCTGWDLADWL